MQTDSVSSEILMILAQHIRAALIWNANLASAPRSVNWWLLGLVTCYVCLLFNSQRDPDELPDS